MKKGAITFSLTLEDSDGNTLLIEEAGTKATIDAEFLTITRGLFTLIRLPILYVRKVELPK